jgi:two-component system phosphate regulon response regulator PhoB
MSLESSLGSPPQAQSPTSEDAEPAVVEHLGIVVDRGRHRAYLDGRELPLTPAEFRLLEFFIAQPGRAFSRKQLIKAIAPDKAITELRTADQHVKTLRRKLGSPDLVEAVRGIGYRFRETRREPT